MSGKQGLPRAERVTRTKDYDRIFAEGRRRRGQLLSVCCLPNGLGHPRLGIALGRGWRGSVARSRAKRLVREAYRTHKHDLPAGLDIIVVPRTNWRPPSVEDIADELCRLLRDVEE